MDRYITIVAISPTGRDSVSVDIEALVDDEVAVLIAPVTDLDSVGKDTIIAVVTITPSDRHPITIIIHSPSDADAGARIADVTSIGASHIFAEVSYTTGSVDTVLSR